MGTTRWIRASEIQSYCYCARNWWLHHAVGLKPEDSGQFVEGTEQHQRHGRHVVRAKGLHRIGLLILLTAFLLAVIAVLWLLRGG